MMAARNFQSKQGLEKGVVDLYAEIIPTLVAVPATATLNLSADIVLTSSAVGAARNETTFELVVEAPAANDSDEVLAVFSGTAGAIVCTITPNDGTNNSATPVPLTSAELVELINDGEVSGKNIVLTDASSLRSLQSASGGNGDDLTSSDDQEVEFDGGVTEVPASFVSAVGFASIAKISTGLYEIYLQDAYYKLMQADVIVKWSTAVDIGWQLTSETVNDSSEKLIVLQLLEGASSVELDASARILLKLELKNSSV